MGSAHFQQLEGLGQARSGSHSQLVPDGRWVDSCFGVRVKPLAQLGKRADLQSLAEFVLI